MKVSYLYPPNFVDIRRAVPSVRGQPRILFCYGDTIYNPGRMEITPELFAHEGVHMQQQAEYGVQPWWDLYVTDKAFRLKQEVPAHRAEYLDLCSRGASKQALVSVVRRLAGPLYGSLITLDEARALVSQ